MPTPPRNPTRRDVLKLASLTIAGAGAGIACGSDSPSSSDPDARLPTEGTDAAQCTATGAQTAGPYYPGEPEALMNIVGDRQGVALELRLRIESAGTCLPIAGAEVDVWSADGKGDYSGYAVFQTEGQSWLRGQQLSDAQGEVLVQAIVPGSYPGRAVHLHVKVRATGREELTTQLYFPDTLAAEILAEPDYQGAEQTLNADDNHYADDTLLTTTGDAAAGVAASATLYV